MKCSFLLAALLLCDTSLTGECFGGRRTSTTSLPPFVGTSLRSSSSGDDVSIRREWRTSYDERWQERFEDLQDYIAEEGHCDVPESHGSLGHWVINQRKFYKKGALKAERIRDLERVGFVWDLGERQWMERLDHLRQWKELNGSCNIPQNEGSLGKWAKHQRYLYKKGALKPGRTMRLESLGFEWRVRSGWDDRFRELVVWNKREGNCNVPQGQGALGRWVCRQRTAYSQGTLPKNRVKVLESIGFEWRVRN